MNKSIPSPSELEDSSLHNLSKHEVVCVYCGCIYDHNEHSDFCPLCGSPIWLDVDSSKADVILGRTNKSVKKIVEKGGHF